MGMGLAGLGTASGAAQGLQEILAQRLRERQMALQEQAQREEMDYRNRALTAQTDATAAQREFTNRLAIENLNERKQAGLERFAASDVEATPVGASVTPERADVWSQGGHGGVIRAIPMMGETVEGQPAPPIRFRGFTPQEAQQREMQASAAAERAAAREDSQAAQAENARLNRENASAIANMRRDARVTTVQEFDPETQTIVTVGVDPETGEEKWRKGGRMTADAMGRSAAYGRASKIVDVLSRQAQKIQLAQGAAARIAEPKQRAAAYANIDLDTAEYMSTLKSFAPLIARSLGHTGVLTELDVESVRQGFWQPGESGELRDRKFKNIKSIMESMSQTGSGGEPGSVAPPDGGKSVTLAQIKAVAKKNGTTVEQETARAQAEGYVVR
jgi:hypothetical protein